MGMFEKDGAAAKIYSKRHSIKALAGLFGVVGSFAETLTKLQSLKVPEGGSLKETIKTVSESIVENKLPIQQLITTMATLKVRGTYPSRNLGRFKTFLAEKFQPTVTEIEGIPTAFVTKLTTLTDGLKTLEDFVTTTNGTFSRAVHVANALGKNGKVTVEGIPDKIELKIEVKMDADTLATKLAGTGKLVIAPSDRRLKTDIEHVGVSEGGINIYEFHYVYDTETRWRGVMAQELLAMHPEAVVIDEKGYYAVRYDKIDVEFEKVIKR
jgi:hypothetical protein